MSGFAPYVIDFFVVLLAILVGDILYDKFKAWKDRDLDIGCDYCEKPVPLRRTPDKQAYVCRPCMKAYIAAHEGQFTPEQIKLALRSYRRRQRRRGGK